MRTSFPQCSPQLHACFLLFSHIHFPSHSHPPLYTSNTTQEFCAFNFVGMLQNVAIYPAERDVFYREHADSVYSVTSFFLCYLTLEIPFELITSVIFAILVDLGGGLPRTAQMFWVCFFNCFCIVSGGESLGIMVSSEFLLAAILFFPFGGGYKLTICKFNTLFQHTGFAVNLTSVFLSIAQFMSGVMSINMPSFLQGVNYLSPLRYAIRNLAPYSLRGITFTCTESQRLPNGECVISTGEQVLDVRSHSSSFLSSLYLTLPYPWDSLRKDEIKN